MEDLFVNTPDIEYEDFAKFLKQLLKEESSSEAPALALVAASTKTLAKTIGTKVVWHYMRPFAARELTDEGVSIFYSLEWFFGILGRQVSCPMIQTIDIANQEP